MTLGDFQAQMQRLAGLRFAPATFATHWEALRAVPLDTIKKAVTRAVVTRSDFPSPVELLADCDSVSGPREAIAETGRDEPLPEPVELGRLPNGAPLPMATRMWVYYCDRCSDIGWESVWCGDVATNRQPWIAVHGDCGRYGEHGPHEFTRHCGCYDTNPKLVRDRAKKRTFAPEPAPTRGRR